MRILEFRVSNLAPLHEQRATAANVSLEMESTNIKQLPGHRSSSLWLILHAKDQRTPPFWRN